MLLAAGEGPPAFLTQIAALVVAGAVIGYVCARLRIVPIVGFVVGGLALVFGLFVLRRSDRSDSSSAAKHDKTAAAGV